MKKLIIAITLFLATVITSQAYAGPKINYDDWNDVTVISSEVCERQYGHGLCFDIRMTAPGKWNGLSRDFSQVAKRSVKINFSGDDWYFVKRVEAKVNGQKYTLSGPLVKRNVRSSGYVDEWSVVSIDTNSDVYKNFWKPLANGKLDPNTMMIRVTGENFYMDFKW